MKIESAKFIKITTIVLLSFLTYTKSYTQTITITVTPITPLPVWTIPAQPLLPAGSDYNVSLSEANTPFIQELNVNITVRVLIALLFNRKLYVKSNFKEQYPNMNLSIVKNDSNLATLLCLICSTTGGNTYMELTNSYKELLKYSITASIGTFTSQIAFKLKLEGYSVTRVLDKPFTIDFMLDN